MGKRQLKQIKLFSLQSNSEVIVENKVNKYVVDVFNKTGNYPKIKCTSSYIAVICSELVETTRE